MIVAAAGSGRVWGDVGGRSVVAAERDPSIDVLDELNSNMRVLLFSWTDINASPMRVHVCISGQLLAIIRLHVSSMR